MHKSMSDGLNQETEHIIGGVVKNKWVKISNCLTGGTIDEYGEKFVIEPIGIFGNTWEVCCIKYDYDDDGEYQDETRKVLHRWETG